MNKAARKVIDYCIGDNIGTLIVGYNETFRKDTDMGKINHQHFVNIPMDAYGINWHIFVN